MGSNGGKCFLIACLLFCTVENSQRCVRWIFAVHVKRMYCFCYCVKTHTQNICIILSSASVARALMIRGLKSSPNEIVCWRHSRRVLVKEILRSRLCWSQKPNRWYTCNVKYLLDKRVVIGTENTVCRGLRVKFWDGVLNDEIFLCIHRVCQLCPTCACGNEICLLILNSLHCVGSQVGLVFDESALLVLLDGKKVMGPSWTVCSVTQITQGL